MDNIILAHLFTIINPLDNLICSIWFQNCIVRAGIFHNWNQKLATEVNQHLINAQTLLCPNTLKTLNILKEIMLVK